MLDQLKTLFGQVKMTAAPPQTRVRTRATKLLALLEREMAAGRAQSTRELQPAATAKIFSAQRVREGG